MSRVIEESIELLFAKKISSQKCEDGEVIYATRDRTLHEWTKSFWRPIPVEELENKAWKWLADNAPEKTTPRSTASCAMAVLHEAQALPTRSSDSSVVLPLRNATLEILEKMDSITIKSREPSRADGLAYVLNCNYDSEAQAREFERFLSEVLPDIDVRNYV